MSYDVIFILTLEENNGVWGRITVQIPRRAHRPVLY